MLEITEKGNQAWTMQKHIIVDTQDTALNTKTRMMSNTEPT